MLLKCSQKILGVFIDWRVFSLVGYQIIFLVSRSKCYFFDTRLRNYESARRNCLRMRGKLFEPKYAVVNHVIDTYAQKYFKVNYVRKRQQRKIYWIGINDIRNEDHFVYTSSGGSVTWTNWSGINPNNKRNEDCVEIGWATEGFWNDNKCHAKFYSVCEISSHHFKG